MCVYSVYTLLPVGMYQACVCVCIIAPMAARKNVLFTPYGVVKGVITRGGIVEAITDLLQFVTKALVYYRFIINSFAEQGRCLIQYAFITTNSKQLGSK